MSTDLRHAQHAARASGLGAHYLDTTGARTHVRVEGPPDGPLVVLIPGATLPLFVWDGLTQALTAAGLRTVRYDLFGRGSSGEPANPGPAALDRQLLEILGRTAADEPVHLVGLAYGALIAARLVRQSPQLVRTVTYLAPDGFGVEATGAAERLARRRGWGEAMMRVAGTRIMMSRLEAYSTDPAVVRSLHGAFAPYAGSPALHRAALAALRSSAVQDAGPLYAEADRRGVPTLALWGAADRITPPPDRATMTETFPHARIRMIEGAGHLPHADRPEETVAALLTFVQARAQGNN